MIDMSDETHEACDCGCTEYNELSRRQFVGAARRPRAPRRFFPAWLPEGRARRELTRRTRDVIVSIFLRGGADGLSLCVPFGDANYYAVRPTIAIPRPDATRRTSGIALDNFFALPAGDGGADAGVHGAGSARRARDGLAQQLALALRRAAVHGSRQAGRPEPRHRLARPAPRERARRCAPTRRCARSASPTVCRRRSSARRRRCPSPTRRTSRIGGSATTLDARLAVLQGDYAAAPEPSMSAALDAVEHDRRCCATSTSPATCRRTARSTRTPRSAARCARCGADQGRHRHRGGAGRHRRLGHARGSRIRSTARCTTRCSDFSNALAAFYADVIQAYTATASPSSPSRSSAATCARTAARHRPRSRHRDVRHGEGDRRRARAVEQLAGPRAREPRVGAGPEGHASTIATCSPRSSRSGSATPTSRTCSPGGCPRCAA